MKELSAFSACPGFNSMRAFVAWFLIAFAVTTHAEEKPNQLLTALRSTIISGYVETYVGGIQLPHRELVLGFGVVSNRLVSCALANGIYEVVENGAVIDASGSVVRGRVPGMGCFRGKLGDDGQTFRGRFVFINGERLRVRRFTLTLIR